MSNEVWKSFEDNLLTHSAAHYLMTIRQLLEDNGYARVTDIARHMNITRGSCSISLKPLKKRGLVVEDDNRFLKLSDEGLRLAEMVELNDQLLEKLFHEVLGIDQEQAEVDACKIEHLISLDTSIALAKFIDCWDADKKVVNDFKNELKRHKVKCIHNADECQLCNQICILPGEELKK